MLDYSIINNKPEFTIQDKNGNQIYCKDLLSRSFVGINIEQLNCEPLVVPREYVARPDLISLAKYGDDRYADIICKLNGISNPFELNAGTILFIPMPEFMFDAARGSNATKIPSELVKDNENVDSIGMQYSTKQKLKTEERSPNQQTRGESNYYIDTANNLVFY